MNDQSKLSYANEYERILNNCGHQKVLILFVSVTLHINLVIFQYIFSIFSSVSFILRIIRRFDYPGKLVFQPPRIIGRLYIYAVESRENQKQ